MEVGPESTILSAITVPGGRLPEFEPVIRTHNEYSLTGESGVWIVRMVVGGQPETYLVVDGTRRVYRMTPDRRVEVIGDPATSSAGPEAPGRPGRDDGGRARRRDRRRRSVRSSRRLAERWPAPPGSSHRGTGRAVTAPGHRDQGGLPRRGDDAGRVGPDPGPAAAATGERSSRSTRPCRRSQSSDSRHPCAKARPASSACC